MASYYVEVEEMRTYRFYVDADGPDDAYGEAITAVVHGYDVRAYLGWDVEVKREVVDCYPNVDSNASAFDGA